MKFPVPYFKSVKDTDCGPLALKMALGYLGEEYSFEKLAEEERQIDTGLVWTAGIARAAKKFGFPTTLVSTSNFSHGDNDIDYYKRYAHDTAMLVLKELCDEIKTIGVDIQEKDLSLNELLGYLSTNSIPIVLVNWLVAAGKEGYSGHFLPLSGYDDEYVYVHNPGIANAQAYLPLKKDLFLRAWESKGTDKDTVVISRKTARSLK